MSVLIVAYIGGVIANLIRLFDLLDVPIEERPIRFRDPLYLAQFILMPMVGSFLVYIYCQSGSNLNSLASFHIGLSAPLMVKQMMIAVPTSTQSNVN